MSIPAAAIRASNYYVQEDVIVEILVRLPVKTLMQLKCVCKRWKDIIGSQIFVKEHYEQRSNKERLLIGRHIFNAYAHKGLCSYAALFVDDALEEPAHDLQFPNTIIGAVNGVLCLIGKSDDEIALLNPATRQLKPLPRVLHLLVELPHSEYRYNAIGFGMDPLTGHYKVVLIGNLWHNCVESQPSIPVVFVYNSGTNSWSNVAAFKSRYSLCTGIRSQYLNGIYYWILGKYLYTAGVLAFDMSTHKFEEIQVPDCDKSKVWLLTVRGDSLAMLSCVSQQNETFEVWVMENKGRWNKVAVVGPFPEISLTHCFRKNNELVLHSHASQLNLYNIIAKETRAPAGAAQLSLQEANYRLSWMLFYKESLASIKRDGDDCLVWDASSDVLRIAWAKQH